MNSPRPGNLNLNLNPKDVNAAVLQMTIGYLMNPEEEGGVNTFVEKRSGTETVEKDVNTGVFADALPDLYLIDENAREKSGGGGATNASKKPSTMKQRARRIYESAWFGILLTLIVTMGVVAMAAVFMIPGIILSTIHGVWNSDLLRCRRMGFRDIAYRVNYYKCMRKTRELERLNKLNKLKPLHHNAYTIVPSSIGGGTTQEQEEDADQFLYVQRDALCCVLALIIASRYKDKTEYIEKCLVALLINPDFLFMQEDSSSDRKRLSENKINYRVSRNACATALLKWSITSLNPFRSGVDGQVYKTSSAAGRFILSDTNIDFMINYLMRYDADRIISRAAEKAALAKTPEENERMFTSEVASGIREISATKWPCNPNVVSGIDLFRIRAMLQMLKSLKNMFSDVVESNNNALLTTIKAVTSNSRTDIDKADVRMQFLKSIYIKASPQNRGPLASDEHGDVKLSRSAIATDLFKIATDEELLNWNAVSKVELESTLNQTLSKAQPVIKAIRKSRLQQVRSQNSFESKEQLHRNGSLSRQPHSDASIVRNLPPTRFKPK